MPGTVGAGNAQGKSQNHWKKGDRQLRLPMTVAARIGVYGDEMDQCDPTVVMAGRQQGDGSAVAGQKVFPWGDIEPNSASSKGGKSRRNNICGSSGVGKMWSGNKAKFSVSGGK